jgi:hypothetical protein
VTEGVFDRASTESALVRAFPTGPVPSLLVPETELVALVMTAREVVFSAVALESDLLDALDQTSEPFADFLDLPYGEMTERREQLTTAARHVSAWIDAGCITLVPVHDIRLLAEALR